MHHPEVDFNSFYQQFADRLQLNWLNPSTGYTTTSLCNRANLPYAGLYNPIQDNLITIIDKEHAPYFQTALNKTSSTQAVILADNCYESHFQLSCFQDNYPVPIFATGKNLFSCLSSVLPFCFHRLSPRLVLHGTFMSVLNKGILITGESGVGKSLSALYCIKNQHQLVADDSPYFYQYENQIIGSCPTNLENFIEVRHLGVINIAKLYGLEYIRNHHPLDLIVSLTSTPSSERVISWNLDTEQILGFSVPKLRLPFSENIALLIENAARCLYTEQNSNLNCFLQPI